MLNTMAKEPPAATLDASHNTTGVLDSDEAPLAEAGSSPEIAGSATVASHLGGGMSMSECCGLLSLCIAMIMGVGALALALLRRTGRDRVLWQLPPPHTFTLGRALAPHFSTSPLQRTAVLRL